MRITLRTLLLAGVVTATTVLNGQPPIHRTCSHEVDLALTYDALRNNPVGDGDFWQQGGGLELSAEFYHGLPTSMQDVLNGGTVSEVTLQQYGVAVLKD